MKFDARQEDKSSFEISKISKVFHLVCILEWVSSRDADAYLEPVMFLI